MRPETMATYLSTIPSSKPFRRLRIGFSGRNLLQLAGDQGSISMSMAAQTEADWGDPHTTFTTSPLFAEIEELWLCLGPTEYGLHRALPPICSWFPRVRGPSITINPIFAPYEWFGLGYVLGALRASNVCPVLDTLCVNVPGSVPDVYQLERVLRARLLRRLVVDYNPHMELSVLAEVFALERLVEEFVLGEATLAPYLASDWLLNVRNAFDAPSAVREGWPRWSENPL